MNSSKKQNTTGLDDSYYEYERLPILLKRFSFQEKMRVASIHSAHAILFKKNIHKQHQYNWALPWCLETFVMLSMEAREYADGDFKGRNNRKFINICNTIWKESAIITKIPSGRFDFMDYFTSVLALDQFHLQEQPLIRQYRYWQIFNDDSDPLKLKTIFKQKTGTTYEDFLMLGYLLQVLHIVQLTESQLPSLQKILHFLLYERFPMATKYLCITRSKYIELQQRFADNSNNPQKYVYSLSPSYQYVFVQEDSAIYCPLPHLINQCITSALLYRLTDGDTALRTQIGKHTWEKYLLKLIKSAGIYQEVYPEQKYSYAGSNSLSPDILVRQDHKVLFIDSKSTVPSLGIRLFNAESFESNIRIVAENIIKLYKQIQRFTNYNPFHEKVSCDRNDYWGAIILLEDAFIRRNRYFEEVGRQLRLDENSQEWHWLISHIKIMSLYDIERLCLGKRSIIDTCKSSSESDPFSFVYNVAETTLINQDYLAFKESRDSAMLTIIEDMRKQGLLQ